MDLPLCLPRWQNAFQTLDEALSENINNMDLSDLSGLEEAFIVKLVQVRRKRNGFAAINRLPNELLSFILLVVLEPAGKVSGEGESRGGPMYSHYVDDPPRIRSTLSITHLCHRLRIIALSSPFLWATVSLSMSRELLLLFVERSRNLPLRVYSVPPAAKSRRPTASSLLFSHPYASRVQELHLNLARGTYGAGSSNLVSSLSPNLLYLNLAAGTIFGPTGPAELFPGEDSWNILKVLSLSLDAITLLPCDHFSFLAHLRIALSLAQRDTGITHIQLLHLLANTPRLETLHLEDIPIWLEGDGAAPEDTQSVHLQRLRVLWFTRPGLKGALVILSHLLLPAEVIIQLHWLDSISEICPDQQFDLPMLREPTILEAVAVGDYSYHIRAFGSGSGIWFHFWDEQWNCLPEGVMPSSIKNLGPLLSHVHTVRIATSDHPASMLTAFLRTATPHLPALETLLVRELGTFDHNSLSAALGAALQLLLPASDPGSPLPYPTLQTLHLQAEHDIHDCHPLIRMLDERAHLGHPVTKVILSVNPEYDLEYLKCLRRPRGGIADHVAEYVESNDGLELAWQPWKDPFWRLETPHWPLYPDPRNSKWMWGHSMGYDNYFSTVVPGIGALVVLKRTVLGWMGM
ncbi:hypothetical protein LXA43DRAFT_288759 [Ganoderma leucocontextum]|nr:hypothetical protein LXA43DRAFT_288759 [Ganoderma leucocontextum]